MAFDSTAVKVQGDDPNSSMLAALARVQEVPAGKTLIDQITDEEWSADEPSSWDITVGSASLDGANEADMADCGVIGSV